MLSNAARTRWPTWRDRRSSIGPYCPRLTLSDVAHTGNPAKALDTSKICLQACASVLVQGGRLQGRKVLATAAQQLEQLNTSAKPYTSPGRTMPKPSMKVQADVPFCTASRMISGEELVGLLGL